MLYVKKNVNTDKILIAFIMQKFKDNKSTKYAKFIINQSASLASRQRLRLMLYLCSKS